MCPLIVKDVLLTYPDPNKSFHIETDASDYQVGAIIKQDGKPIAYFSKKLHGAQLNYTVVEKEMLAIVMVLNEYRSLLYGCDIHIYTDHKNLTFHNLKTNRILHWHLFLEEFAPPLFIINKAIKMSLLMLCPDSFALTLPGGRTNWNLLLNRLQTNFPWNLMTLNFLNVS